MDLVTRTGRPSTMPDHVSALCTCIMMCGSRLGWQAPRMRPQHKTPPAQTRFICFPDHTENRGHQIPEPAGEKLHNSIISGAKSCLTRSVCRMMFVWSADGNYASSLTPKPGISDPRLRRSGLGLPNQISQGLNDFKLDAE